jgi:tetratricopeptide (TPR) repeat protein
MRHAVSSLLFAALVAPACATAAQGPPPASNPLQSGIALYQQARYAEAEAALRKATGPEASAYLAGSLAKQKRYAEAEAPAKTALAANPIHPVAVAALGESLAGQKKYDEAIARLSAALAAKNDLAYAYFWRAQSYYGKQQPDKMVGDFETFLKLMPNAPEAPSVKQLLASLRR